MPMLTEPPLTVKLPAAERLPFTLAFDPAVNDITLPVSAPTASGAVCVVPALSPLTAPVVSEIVNELGVAVAMVIFAACVPAFVALIPPTDIPDGLEPDGVPVPSPMMVTEPLPPAPPEVTVIVVGRRICPPEVPPELLAKAAREILPPVLKGTGSEFRTLIGLVRRSMEPPVVERPVMVVVPALSEKATPAPSTRLPPATALFTLVSIVSPLVVV